ncbi:MAG: NUDIX hydrolase [Pseudomonadota bacterium]
MVRSLHEGRFLALRERERWEYCERTNATGVVTIAALTPARELILTEQFRPPVRAAVFELPAGLAGDEPGTTEESLATAARRELEEETGFRALELVHVGRGPSSAGLTSELIDFFIAPKTERIGPGGGTAGENITVHLVPIAAMGDWIQARFEAGDLVDPKVLSGLWYLARCG